MKLLCIIGTLQAGGAERVLSILSNSLIKYDCEITIVTFDGREPFYSLDPKIKLLNLNLKAYGKGTFSKLYGLYGQVSALKNVIKVESPDVVISYITEMNVISVIAAKLSSKPIIISEHTNFIGVKSLLWKSLRRLIYPFSNMLVILTKFDKDYYTFVKHKKVLPNPLNLTHNHHDIEREKIILGVGRLIELKGFDRLIQAFSKLKSTEWKLVIIGEGEKREALEALINRYKLKDKVILEGLVKDVEKYYKKSSIYVLSSKTEGYPMGLCEAMAYGCAPIAFDIVTGPGEIITHHKNGILVKDNDIEQLTVEMQNLMDNPNERESLSIEAMKIESKLNVKVLSEVWIELIKLVIK